MDMDPEIIGAIVGGIFTLVAGGIAFVIYTWQKKDFKRNTAKTLFYDIVYSEKVINGLKHIKAQDDPNQILNLDANKHYITIGNWNEIKYLFINDLTTHEWEMLNKFFSECETINKTLDDIKSTFYTNVNPRAETIQSKLGEAAKEYANALTEIDFNEKLKADQKEDKKNELRTRMETLTTYLKNYYIDDQMFQYQYKAAGFYTYFNTSLILVDTSLSISSVGQKIKKIAEIN